MDIEEISCATQSVSLIKLCCKVPIIRFAGASSGVTSLICAGILEDRTISKAYKFINTISVNETKSL